MFRFVSVADAFFTSLKIPITPSKLLFLTSAHQSLLNLFGVFPLSFSKWLLPSRVKTILQRKRTPPKTKQRNKQQQREEVQPVRHWYREWRERSSAVHRLGERCQKSFLVCVLRAPYLERENPFSSVKIHTLIKTLFGQFSKSWHHTCGENVNKIVQNTNTRLDEFRKETPTDARNSCFGWELLDIQWTRLQKLCSTAADYFRPWRYIVKKKCCLSL